MGKASDRTGDPAAEAPGAEAPGAEARTRSKREQIERNLKRVYDETLEEPLPDELADLLERLKQQGRK